ncbi:hypothetical protein JST97_30195 [bacterium]|nr:hypothetical protein [bacterium]
MIFLVFFLAVAMLSMRWLAPKRPPGGLAALPLPPLEASQTRHFQTATFALG